MQKAADIGLLLLHALPLDGRMWRHQCKLWADKTYAPTLYGFGDTLTDWAEGCLARVPHARCVVVGCSVGGSCALEIMHHAPERVAAAILIGTKARHDPNPAQLDAHLQTLRDHGVAQAWARDWRPLFGPDDATGALEIATDIALAQSAAHLRNGLKAFHTRPSSEDTVRHSTVPIHIVTGAQDRLPGRAYAQHLANLSPNAKLHVFENCGHYVPLMKPAQLNALIQDTLHAVSQT